MRMNVLERGKEAPPGGEGRADDQRQRVDLFWRSCLERRKTEFLQELSDLDRQLGIYPLYSSERIWSSDCRLVGSATKQAVEEFFYPGSYDFKLRLNRNGKRSFRRGSGAGGRRLFRGRGWNELLVLPFHEAADRITSFLFVGRAADPAAGDLIYRSVQRRPSLRRTGVALLEAMQGPLHRYLGDRIFLLADPLTALRVHARTLRSTAHLLPVAGLSPINQKHLNLQACLPQGRKPIFWSPTSNDDLLVAARHVNGLVASGAPYGDPGCRSTYPLQWLRVVEQLAVPWREVLRDRLLALPHEQAVALIKRLQIDRHELQQVMSGSSGRLTRLQQLAPQPPVAVRGQPVVETTVGWAHQRTGVEICNGRVHLDEVLYCRTGRPWLRGRIELDGSTIPFQLREDEVRRHGLFACLTKLAPAFHYRAGWNGRSELLMRRMSQPEVRAEADVVGWHDCRYWFPNFSLQLGGRVSTTDMIVRDGESAPAENLQPPTPLSNYALQLLSRHDRPMRLFWAATAAIAANVVAPMRPGPPQGIALVGDGAQVLGREAAKLLGCREYTVPTGQRGSWIAQQLSREVGRHNWPLVLVPPHGKLSAGIHHWLSSTTNVNCLLPVSNPAEASYLQQLGWCAIRSEKRLGTLEPLRWAGSKVLPLYLQDVCRRRGARYGLAAVLEDLGQWFGEQGGDREAVRRASHLFRLQSLAKEQPEFTDWRFGETA